VIVGTAIVFGPRDSDGRNLRLRAGCFNAAALKDVLCLWNHRFDCELGSTREGNLKLRADGRGVHFQLLGYDHLPDDFTGCSYLFTDEEYEERGEMTIVTRARLVEISLLTGDPPAYPETKRTIRAVPDKLSKRNRRK
jgi:phage head maturation protease